MNRLTPSGSKFILAYQCLITPENGQPCGEDDETSTFKCAGGKAAYKEGETCYQAMQCQSGNCSDENQCVDPKEDGEPCSFNHECKNKYCGVTQAKCNGKATPIQSSIDKTCQPAGHLKLNDECEDDINCGEHNSV